jgi:hypothetical protein
VCRSRVGGAGIASGADRDHWHAGEEGVNVGRAGRDCADRGGDCGARIVAGAWAGGRA